METQMSADDGKTLRLERVIRAPVKEVYDAWTIPERTAAWFGPEGVTVTDYAMDVRPGGQWYTVMNLPDGNKPRVSGVYRAIEPNRRLVFTWAWDQEDGRRGHETEVTVTFEPVGDDTRLILVQTAFAEPVYRDNHQKGWTSTLNDLERVLKKAA
jgi:uncharacterized protein YndB with AHSA1/START domain